MESKNGPMACFVGKQRSKGKQKGQNTFVGRLRGGKVTKCLSFPAGKK